MQKNYNILIVDDTPENIDLLVGVLEDEYNLQAVTSGEAAIKVAKSTNQPDLILLDVMMPEMNGYEVCKTLKYYESTRHIPIIFVTAKNETFDEERGFKLGAADYITKPINPPLVLARVKTHLTNSNITKELAYEVDKLKNELDILYTTDKLTGFKNMKGLQQDLEGDSNKSLLLLDICRMHEINEHYGYKEGDYILKQVAKEVTDAFSKLDVALYRTHGDQFAILAHGDCYEEFQECVNVFIDALDLKLFPVREDDTQLCVSIQVCAGFVKNANEDLLIKASMALHEAKKENNSLVVHAYDGHLKNKKNIEIVSNLYKAISENRIEVHYQPIVDNATQKIVKYETLVRTVEEDGSIVMPYIFLEAAKRARLYPFLTKEVIHQALSEFKDRDEEISVNIAWDDISNPITRTFILEKIDQHPTPHKVIFELVETEALSDSQLASDFLKKLKQRGCKIAIDDFGSGFSNFEYLVQIDVDIIKIDGSLIKDIDTNTGKQAIVHSIVSFAKDLGIETVAEFVASQALYDVVKSMGITYSQGYHFGKPQAKIG